MIADRYDNDKYDNGEYDNSRYENERHYCRSHPMVWLLLLFCLGFLPMRSVLEQSPSCLHNYIGQQVTLTGVVQESQEGQAYLWLRINPQSNAVKNVKKEVLYVGLPWEDNTAQRKTRWYPAGTTLQVTGQLEKPQNQQNPGGFDEASWLRSKQAKLKLKAEHIQVLQPPQGIWRFVWKTQCWLKDTVRQFLSAQQQGLAFALLLGETQQLDPSFYGLSQRMGIAHIFAVSGLHVGFVGAFVVALLHLAGWERRWSSFFCLAVTLGFYCLLTGCPPSALRAAGMVLLSALAMQLLRPPAPVDFLALAALLLLLRQPFLLGTAGFQLSFGVTLSLLLFVRPLQNKLGWIGVQRLRESVAVAMAAYLGSLPLTAWHFYTVSLLSPLYNIGLVAIVSVLVPVLLAACLATAVLPVCGSLFFLPVRFLLALLYQGTLLLSAWTGQGHWYIGRPSWIAIGCYLLFLLCLWRWLRKEKSRRIVLCFAVVCLALTIVCVIPKPPDGDELLYLDAGQGSCAVLRTAAGETVIFDGGTSQRELASCLAWYGVNHVDAVVLSHGDLDHIGGIQQVLEQVPVQYLCIEANQMQRKELCSLLALAETRGVSVKPVQKNAKLILKQGEIILTAMGNGSSGTNSRELTAFVQLPDTTIAFPGDLGIQDVQQFVMVQKTIGIWTVPHHGSRFSSNAVLYGLLQQKGVQLAVISAGRENRYGHPHREVLQQLHQNRIAVQRTDLQGAVLLQLRAYGAHDKTTGQSLAE